jgi:serine phosphatase RsbU (regulator of sigma subunit)
MGFDDELYGEARLLQVVRQGRVQPLQANAAEIMSSISRWHGSESPQDDISILLVELSPASALSEIDVEALENQPAIATTR